MKSLLRKSFARSVLLLAGFSLFFCATAQAGPSIWVIRDRDSTIYLVGTIHLLRHESEWNADKLKKIVAQSKELWLEVSDPDNQAALMPLIQKYGYDSEKTLSSKLTEEQKTKLTKTAEKYQVPVSTLEPMQPWMVALMLAVLPLQQAGFDPNAGVDHILMTEAQRKGEAIKGFETLEEQVRFLAELPQSDQVAFLDDTLDDAIGGIEMLDKLAKAWMDGDNKTIAELLVQEVKQRAPTIYDKLLVRRNIQWADKIVKIMDGSGVQLIAVGAGHLSGPDSVQVQLEKRGIKVEPY